MPAKRRRRFKGYRPEGTYDALCREAMPPIGEMRFSGSTYDEKLDQYRLGSQLNDVWQYIKDGEWHYPEEMEEALDHRWASMSARLRDFRKDRFGAHNIERERVRGGSWRYRLVRDE